MPNGFDIAANRHTYRVEFVDDFRSTLLDTLRAGDVLIIDRKVHELYASQFKELPSNAKTLLVDATEDSKSYAEIGSVIQQLLDLSFRKNHRLVAIGGGITQDITAFIASVMFRGVDWVFFPTTLLAQCDSCIGSKTSVNFGRYKNQLGGFHPPSLIGIDLKFTRTLDERDFLSGIGEMAHYYVISGEADFEMFAQRWDRARTDMATLTQLVERSLAIKKPFAEQDEYDRGPRNVLNYGHTFGHALESATNYRIPHGIAVSIGMDAANAISVHLGLLSEATRHRVRTALQPLWQGVDLGEVDMDAYITALRKDKKVVDGQLRAILCREIGDVFIQRLALTDQVIEVIREQLGSLDKQLGATHA